MVLESHTDLISNTSGMDACIKSIKKRFRRKPEKNMPLACALRSCKDPYYESKNTQSENRLVIIQPCKHTAEIYAHRGCSSRAKASMKCTSCLNRLSSGEMISASSENAKARLSDWASDPLGEAGNFIGRSIDRSIGMAKSTSKKPHYDNEDQRKGGAFVSGMAGDRKRSVTSYESAVGRRTGDTVNAGVQIYKQVQPVYKAVGPVVNSTRLIRR